MLDKSQRVERLVERLAEQIGLNEGETAAALRAAHLCKADLVSHMVVEMTSLQGIMGQYYALHSGESAAVAQAIYEHYLPRYAGDALPQSRPGLVVGLADRLDSLAGLFAAGLAPSGTKDPFALRRAALGLVQNLIVWNVDFDLVQALMLAAENLPIEAPAQTQAECLEFIVGRMRNYLIEQGYRFDVVDAVLAAQRHNPASAMRAVKELSEWVARPDWNEILPAYARCVRITRDQREIFTVRPEALGHAAEKDLYEALLVAEGSYRRPGSVADFFVAFLPMIPVINRFFEEVLVMSEHAGERANRLGLLQRISALPKDAADLSYLEGF
jgi:glycyl-tRNA synthetase